MNTAELAALLDRLRAEPREAEWLEFKANRHEPQLLGEYWCRCRRADGYQWRINARAGFRFEPWLQVIDS